MGYIQLFGAAVMWSLVGTLVKSASRMVDSNTVSLCRFLFGCLFLAVWMMIKRIPIRLVWRNKWIWIGVTAKSLSYLCENFGITLGFAYGNVIVVPIQVIFLTLASVLLLGEELAFHQLFAVLLCTGGVLLVSWKGAPLSELLGTGFLTTALFILTGIGAGIHIICQKKLIAKTDSGNMNLSMFLFSTFLVALPVPLTFRFTGGFQPMAAAALVGLGIITGLSFYLYAEALKKVSFFIAGILSNSSVLFTLLWSRLFFRETINGYVITGAVLMLAGLVIINIPQDLISKTFGKWWKPEQWPSKP